MIAGMDPTIGLLPLYRLMAPQTTHQSTQNFHYNCFNKKEGIHTFHLSAIIKFPNGRFLTKADSEACGIQTISLQKKTYLEVRVLVSDELCTSQSSAAFQSFPYFYPPEKLCW